MGDLSKDFSSSEFRCPCCGKLMIYHYLIVSLQELRDRAHEPVQILSGFRCPAHNEEVGGAEKSQHLFGRAADIFIPGWSVREMYLMARSVPAFYGGGIGQYKTGEYIHVDVRGKQARWYK